MLLGSHLRLRERAEYALDSFDSAKRCVSEPVEIGVRLLLLYRQVGQLLDDELHSLLRLVAHLFSFYESISTRGFSLLSPPSEVVPALRCSAPGPSGAPAGAE